MNHNDVVGIILAGGASSRMGTDKSQLVLEGETLLDRSRNTLCSVELGQIVISGSQIGAIADSEPLRGPAAAIINVLIQARLASSYNYCAVIPVDMPMLSTDLISCLIEKAKRHKAGAYYQDYFLPCVLPIANLIENYEQRDGRYSGVGLEQSKGMPMKVLLKLAKSIAVDCEDKSALKNVNDKSAWNEIKRVFENQ